uniref:hypothetical protein n=1 Tax=Prevotella sp. TaxID=59823 RepID=UPI004028A4DD
MTEGEKGYGFVLAHHNEIEPAEADGDVAVATFVAGEKSDVLYSLHALDKKTDLISDYAKLRPAIALDKFKELLSGGSGKKDGENNKLVN